MLDELLERGLVSPTFAYRDRSEGLIAELDLALLAQDTPYPYRVQCEQSKLTPILLAHLAAHPEARSGSAGRSSRSARPTTWSRLPPPTAAAPARRAG